MSRGNKRGRRPRQKPAKKSRQQKREDREERAHQTDRVPLRIPVDDPTEEGLVTLRFLGGAQTTTGSLHRLRTPKGDLALECGLYQGHRAEAERWNRKLPVDVERLQAVVLSHGHIDHCGALPNLVRNGFRGKVWCTDATADLLPVMLLDSAHIQESDVERLNRRRSPDQPPLEPLYTVADAERALELISGVPYGKEFDPFEGVTGRFVDAGHIIGSAAVHLTVRAGGEQVRIGFTGDLGRRHAPILRDPEPLGAVDVYLTEATYGDRDHEGGDDVAKHLRQAVLAVSKRGGKLIIPAFAVGRTQLVLYLLHRLREADQIPDIPIYVDSPMATRATEVFQKNSGIYDKEAREFLEGTGSLFGRARTSFVASVEESKALNHLDGPAIIISASGMCEGGRVLHHLRNHGPDPRNAILFVGYQAEHTLGRRLIEGQRDVRIYGDDVRIEADVEKINGLSAHADRRGLLDYAKRLDTVPEKIFLVHGEEDRLNALRDYFDANGFHGSYAPQPGEWKRLI